MLDILGLLVKKHLCYHKDPNLNRCRMTGPTRKLSFRPLIGWWWPKPTTRLPWGAKGLLAFYDSSSPIFLRWAVVDIRMSEKSCRRPGLDWHAERRFIDESVHKLYTSPREKHYQGAVRCPWAIRIRLKRTKNFWHSPIKILFSSICIELCRKKKKQYSLHTSALHS